jgi:type IV secretory pathway protease TraF
MANAVCVALPAKIVYNPSDSVPRGWYHVETATDTGALHVGSIVLARIPADAAALAAQPGYLPAGIPILKPIGAVSPQPVCIEMRRRASRRERRRNRASDRQSPSSAAGLDTMPSPFERRTFPA